MTREEALALYHPIRASVRRILTDGIDVCNQSDFKRAAKQLGLCVDEKIILPEGDKAPKREPGDFEVTQRMGTAFFSLFRRSGRHGIAGVWLDDLLDGDRRVWLMDESMETSATTRGAFGMRLFDAGQFHVGFGIVAPSDEETTEFSAQGMMRKWSPAIPAFARSDAVWR